MSIETRHTHDTHNDILVKLSDETLILDEPSQDIRHRSVIDRNGEVIGHVSDLFVDQAEKRVRMLEVAAGGFLGLGDRHFLVPVDAIVRVTAHEVHIDQTSAKVVASPAYDPKLSDVPPRDVWGGYYGYYGFSPYWSAGYINPTFRASISGGTGRAHEITAENSRCARRAQRGCRIDAESANFDL